MPACVMAVAPVAQSQNIWWPQNHWNTFAPEFNYNLPPNADVDANTSRRGTGTQNPATGGRTSFTLVTNGTAFACDVNNTIHDHVKSVMAGMTTSSTCTKALARPTTSLCPS